MRKNHYESGSDAKEHLANRKAGWIAIPVVMVNVNHVADRKEKRDRSIHHADQHQQHVNKKAKVKRGVKQNDKSIRIFKRR